MLRTNSTKRDHPNCRRAYRADSRPTAAASWGERQARTSACANDWAVRVGEIDTIHGGSDGFGSAATAESLGSFVPAPVHEASTAMATAASSE